MIDFEILAQSAGLFFYGMQLTLLIAAISCCLGIFLGGVSGIILSGKSRFLCWLVMGYVTVIRGTPMLIQITAMYFLLQASGFGISAFWSVVISIGLNSGAYMSQIVLSGIKSVSKGQIEAAKVLGFSNWQIMQLIVLPQAIRIMIPAFGNEFVTLVKDSSLASTVGVCELTQQGNIIIGQTWDAPTVYVALGLIYLCITTIISLFVSKIDKKLNHYAHR